MLNVITRTSWNPSDLLIKVKDYLFTHTLVKHKLGLEYFYPCKLSGIQFLTLWLLSSTSYLQVHCRKKRETVGTGCQNLKYFNPEVTHSILVHVLLTRATHTALDRWKGVWEKVPESQSLPNVNFLLYKWAQISVSATLTKSLSWHEGDMRKHTLMLTTEPSTCCVINKC